MMGTAMVSGVGYWFSLSVLIYCLSFIFNTSIDVFEILSLTGYSLFPFCIVLIHVQFLYIFPALVPESLPILLFAVFGSSGALRTAQVLRSRTTDAKQVRNVISLIHALICFSGTILTNYYIYVLSACTMIFIIYLFCVLYRTAPLLQLRLLTPPRLGAHRRWCYSKCPDVLFNVPHEAVYRGARLTVTSRQIETKNYC